MALTTPVTIHLAPTEGQPAATTVVHVEEVSSCYCPHVAQPLHVMVSMNNGDTWIAKVTPPDDIPDGWRADSALMMAFAVAQDQRHLRYKRQEVRMLVEEQGRMARGIIDPTRIARS